ncbi:tyrosine-type recombinase/integrase [Protofrankia coriariae]|uniref:Integrase n=1 Tax=Protofrankia coriariae TaxID=1562887 RepID=A0ABR5F0E5_9ACTN|nr:site-specific integrase [Protofrankia coriariae]KLL10170.1 integrase [Protofrankia coriariae]ONH37515.1 site-specific integrase [Protofrankia sp. BMG5.30]
MPNTLARRGRRRSHGDGALFQRASDGLWVGRVDLGWIDGKRVRKTVYAKTEKECRRKLKEVQKAAEQGVNLNAPNRTVSEWLTEWVRMKSEDGTRPTTVAGYKWAVDLYIVPVVGRVQLLKLTPSDVTRVIGKAREAGRSPRSLQFIHGVLRNALADAHRLDLVPRNVAKAVKGPSVPLRRVRALHVDDVRALSRAMHDDPYGPIFICGLMLGLRRGEILGLRWADIDFDAGALHVRRTLQRANGKLMFMPAKTVRSHRTLPLSGSLVEILKEHRRSQEGAMATAGPDWIDHDLVFASAIGTPLDPRNVNRRFTAIRTAAGLPWVRLHDLRHAFATLLVAEGVPMRVIMELLGHSTINLTMNTYAHVLPEAQEDAVARLDGLVMGDDQDEKATEATDEPGKGETDGVDGLGTPLGT